jgi:hypothetical protein
MEIRQDQHNHAYNREIPPFHQIIVNGVVVYEGYDREEALELFRIAEENAKNEHITYRINKVIGRFTPNYTSILAPKPRTDELPTLQIKAVRPLNGERYENSRTRR